jgi:hypothetical protein
MIPPPALPTTMALLNRIDQHHFNLPLSPLNTIKQTINKPTPKTLDTKAAPPHRHSSTKRTKYQSNTTSEINLPIWVDLLL